MPVHPMIVVAALVVATGWDPAILFLLVVLVYVAGEALRTAGRRASDQWRGRHTT